MYHFPSFPFSFLQSLRKSIYYYGVNTNPNVGLFAIRHQNYKAHYHTAGNANIGKTYHDEDCRPTSKLTVMSPEVVYDLSTDPSELYPLDRTKYAEIFDQLQQMRDKYESNMTWRTSEIYQRKMSLQPCINPGCKPMPVCCREGWSESAFMTRNVIIKGKKKKKKKGWRRRKKNKRVDITAFT